MTFYAGNEVDYGNTAVKSLANDIETALLGLIPEIVHADVKQRRKLILTIAQGVITHINQHIEAQATQMNLKADKVVVQSATVELSTGATHPAVLGDELTNYLGNLVTAFNNHVHGGGGTPSANAPAVPAALVSTKVKLG
jgi:hypothetical protein